MRKSFYKVLLCLLIVIPLGSELKAQITATIDTNNTWCNLNNGSAEVYPSGGTGGGYTYQWSNGGSTTDTISGLAPGAYSVTVYFGTDSVVIPFHIQGSVVPVITITALHDSMCLGTPDQLIASSTPAVPQYIWSASNGLLAGYDTALSINATALNANTYTFTVTPGFGCAATGTFVIVSYPVVATLVNTIEPTCGLNNGTIQCSSTTSNSINTFLENDSVVQTGSSVVLDSAGPGTYTFIIFDPPTGCTDTVTNIILTDNSVYPIVSNVAVTPEQCFGNNKGAINVTVGNCGGGCTFSWTPNTTDNTDSATGLPAGSDTLFITSNGCTVDTIISVPGPTSTLTGTLTTHPDHCGKSIGTAFDSTTGGVGPYTYVWSMGNSLGDSVTNLVGDSMVYVTVTDSHMCTVIDSAMVGSTPKPTAVLTPSDTICVTDSNGVLIITPTSADGPFTYLWSNGKTTGVNAGLTPGAYSVTVSDAVGCDTVLQAAVPAYLAQLSLAATPPSPVYAGQQVVIELSTNVPFTNITWDPYIPASLGSTVAGFQAEQTTQYTVTVSYGLDCQISQNILITVLADSVTKWVIPNTFTPNDDHINDFFKLITYPNLKSFQIWIYDRWGNKVYESTDPEFQWDGSDHYAGNGTLNSGVFAYVIQYQELNSDTKKTIGGNISLIK